MNVKSFSTIGNDGYNYTCGYFTANKWLCDDRLVLARSKDREISRNSELVIYNIGSSEFEVITTSLNSWLDYVIYENRIYYLAENELRLFNVATKVDSSVCNVKGLGLGSPHVTHDGKYMSLFSYSDSDGMKAYRVDLRSGKLTHVFSKSFTKPLCIANHLMISPADENLFFFAHEGDTRSVCDRLWLYREGNGTCNIAKQMISAVGTPEDCFGHEMWAPDGKGLYFVKYPLSVTRPFGICYADANTGEYKILFSAFDYWHVAVSADGRYLTADTIYPGKSEIVLIDIEKGTENLIDISPSRKKHPNHPHPALSPDNTRLIYNSIDDLGNDCVRIAFLEI